MSGKPCANSVRTDTPIFTASLRTSATTSRINPLISRCSFRAAPFLDRVTAVLFCPKPCQLVADLSDFVRFGSPAVPFCHLQLRPVG